MLIRIGAEHTEKSCENQPQSHYYKQGVGDAKTDAQQIECPSASHNKSKETNAHYNDFKKRKSIDQRVFFTSHE
jgi:hypothetical protein